MKLSKINEKELNTKNFKVTMPGSVTSILKDIVHLLFPEECALCRTLLQKKEKGLCQKCLGNIILNMPPFCPKCSRHVYKKDLICPECLTKHSPLDRMFSCLVYNDALKPLIIMFKYYNHPYLLISFSQLIKDFCSEHLSCLQIDIMTFVPLHWQKLFIRDFDPAFIISEKISLFTQIPLEPILFKHRKTPQQHFQSKKKRESNLKGAFQIIPGFSVKNKNILLVDDVFTTGNTLNECAKTLKKNGAKKVYGFALARGL